MADWDLRRGMEIAEALSGYIGVPARRIELAQDIAAALRAARREGMVEAMAVAENANLTSGSIGPLMDHGWACAQQTIYAAIQALLDQEPMTERQGQKDEK